MLEKEFERAGIPAVLITALLPIARTIRANRITQGVGITSPLGDPGTSRPDEKVLRREIVLEALDTLTREPADNRETRAAKATNYAERADP